MNDLPPGLPEQTRDSYRSYLTRAALTRELLTARVKRYLDTVSRARGQSAELDIGTAGVLGGALLRLLRECEDAHLPHVQAAVYYFVESEDASPDLESGEGFTDDAAVYNAVCAHLGLKQLRIDLDFD